MTQTPPDGWVYLDNQGLIHESHVRKYHFFGSIQEDYGPDLDYVDYLNREWPGLAPFTIHEFRISPDKLK